MKHDIIMLVLKLLNTVKLCDMTIYHRMIISYQAQPFILLRRKSHSMFHDLGSWFGLEQLLDTRSTNYTADKFNNKIIIIL